MKITSPGEYESDSRNLYTAPEQLNDERYDEKTDVYSLGMLLLEMVSKLTRFEITGSP